MNRNHFRFNELRMYRSYRWMSLYILNDSKCLINHNTNKINKQTSEKKKTFFFCPKRQQIIHFCLIWNSFYFLYFYSKWLNLRHLSLFHFVFFFVTGVNHNISCWKMIFVKRLLTWSSQMRKKIIQNKQVQKNQELLYIK